MVVDLVGSLFLPAQFLGIAMGVWAFYNPGLNDPRLGCFSRIRENKMSRQFSNSIQKLSTTRRTCNIHPQEPIHYPSNGIPVVQLHVL